ncbi:MAG: hypothetical protein JSV00_05645 [bacterium]|nr:MAG: hypothetical protein JSV00_05645 [bacterium]
MKSADHSVRIPMPKPLIQVQLVSGRRIAAVQLHVGFTYGTYTKVFQEVQRLKEINLELLFSEYPAKVLWERKFPSVLLRRDEYSRQAAAALPVYKMTALFESGPLEENSGKHSAMVVNWVQDEMNPILSPRNRQALRALAWEEHAKDFR